MQPMQQTAHLLQKTGRSGNRGARGRNQQEPQTWHTPRQLWRYGRSILWRMNRLAVC